MYSLMQKIFDMSDQVVDGRIRFQILAHIMEEVGELSEELLIDQGLSYKKKGKDGVIGEAIDAIICLVDMIHQTDPSLTEADLIRIAEVKLEKWKLTVGQHRSN